MVFSGITFLMYFLPLFFAVYFLIPFKYKNLWIVIASLVFYSWGAPVFIFTVLLSCAIDYIAALNFEKKFGKYWCYFAVVSNVALLGYFKYADFFIDNFNHIARSLSGSEIPLANIVLPVGISFITFQKISYLIDVYRKDCMAQKNFLNYVLFVILFPQLIAGPIVRYKEVAGQITGRKNDITAANTFSGLIQFIIGLSKKVLIANTLGNIADFVFNSGPEGAAMAWVGILAYTFQIYFDFSGYSDMAIGMGRMLGFRFPENFRFPYVSGSITEFWKRWHMTLGSWMKDYLYIPLGGNRGNTTYRNLFVVFFLSGLWHGASWNFVLWGVLHGSFLVVERMGLSQILKKQYTVVSILYTFLVVVTAWVLFRAENIAEAMAFYSQLINFQESNFQYLNSINTREIVVFLAACIFSFVPKYAHEKLTGFYFPAQKGSLVAILIGTGGLVLYVLNLGELMATGFNPFIYFRF